MLATTLLLSNSLLVLSARSQASSGSLVYLENGKADAPVLVDLLPASNPLENYLENIEKISKWDASQLERRLESHSTNNGFQVAIIGSWHQFQVIDVSHHEASHKSIILRDESGNHELLYTQFKHSTAGVNDLPMVRTIDGHQILSYETDLPGTGNFRIQYFFCFDQENEDVRRLALDDIIDSVNEILPANHYIAKYPTIDLENMSLVSLVHKKGDGNCCPTGGSVSARLKIVNDHFELVNVSYLSANSK